MTVNAITLAQLAPLSSATLDPTDRTAQTSNVLGVPHAWIEADFCGETGILRFIPLLKTQGISVDGLFDRWIEIGYQNVSMRTYFDALLQEFTDWPCKLYLRGSYATYLLNPHQILHEIIQDFIRQNPHHRGLMESVQPFQPVIKEPDDSDWALLFDQPPNAEELIKIKQKLIALNASLGNLPFEEAQARTFANLFIAQPNPLTQFSDPIVIASFQGNPKLDLVVGHLQKAPYLFTCDNHYIRIGSLCTPEFTAQSIVDSCLGIVRAEGRHALDFRALIKAVKHRSQGKKWDESVISFRKIFTGFLDLPTEVLVKAIQRKILEKAVEPVSFVLNFLDLVDHPARLQELWHALCQHVTCDPRVSFQEACGGVVLYKERFQNAIGLTPHAERNLRALKGVLLKQLPDAPPLVETVVQLLAEGWIDEEDEKRLNAHLGVESLFDWLVANQRTEEAFNYLFRKHHLLSVSDQLDRLRTYPHFKRHLLRFLQSLPDREQGFLSCLEKGILVPNQAAFHLFRELFAAYEGSSLIAWLKRVGLKIKSDEKKWIIDLWLSFAKEERIPLSDFQKAIENWLSSGISARVKLQCLIEIRRTMGFHAFTSNAQQQAIPLFADAQQEDLEDWMLELDDPKSFYYAHQRRLEAGWQSLFQKAIASNHTAVLLPCFQRSPHYPQILKTALPSIPAGNRLQWIYLLPEAQWPQYSEVLSAEENNQLQLEILRKSPSIFALYSLKRNKVPVPNKLESMVLKHFRETKLLKGPQVTEGVKSIVDALQIDALLEILPKLDREVYVETRMLLEERIKRAISNADLEALQKSMRNREMRKFAPIDPSWLKSMQVHQEQAKILMSMLELPDLEPALFLALCSLYLTLQRTANEETAFQKALFHVAPHPLPTPLFEYLMRNVLVNPDPLKNQIEEHRHWLIEPLQKDGETLCSFYLLLLRLKINLPQVTPAGLIQHLKSSLENKELRTLAWILLPRKEAVPLQFELLSAIIKTNEIEHFVRWLQSCLLRLNPEEKRHLLDQIETLQLWMEYLLQYLKSNRVPPLEAFVQIFLERYLNKYSTSTPETFSSLHVLPIRNYALFIPLLHNEYQRLDFFNWLTPDKTALPGVPQVVRHLVGQDLQQPGTGDLQKHFESIEICLKDSPALILFGKFAFRRYVDSGIGSICWLKYAVSEQELRDAMHCLANEEWHLDEDTYLDVVDHCIQLTNEQPDVRWGEPIATLFMQIVEEHTAPGPNVERGGTLDFAFILGREEEDLEPSIRLPLLLKVATFSQHHRSEEAYRQLMDVLMEVEHVPLEALELMTRLMFNYPNINHTNLVYHLIRITPDIGTQKERLKKDLLMSFGLLRSKPMDAWGDDTLVDFVITLIGAAEQLGNVDLSHSPYCELLSKAYSVLARLKPVFLPNLFDLLSKNVMTYHKYKNQGQLLNRFIPDFIQLCLNVVDEEDFTPLLKGFTIIHDLVRKILRFEPKLLDYYMKDFLNRVISNPIYNGKKSQLTTLLSCFNDLTRTEDQFYFSLFFIEHEEQKEFINSCAKKMSPKTVSSVTRLAIEMGYLRKDITGAKYILRAFRHHASLGIMTEKDRREFINKLIPFIHKVIGDQKSAYLYMQRIIDHYPKEATPQEREELKMHLETFKEPAHE